MKIVCLPRLLRSLFTYIHMYILYVHIMCVRDHAALTTLCNNSSSGDLQYAIINLWIKGPPDDREASWITPMLSCRMCMFSCNVDWIRLPHRPTASPKKHLKAIPWWSASLSWRWRVSGSGAGGRQPVMRRGVTFGERGADKAADWEPLVLTAVSYFWRGSGGWSHIDVTQNHTSVQLPSWVWLHLFWGPNLTAAFVVQGKYIQLCLHESWDTVKATRLCSILMALFELWLLWQDPPWGHWQLSPHCASPALSIWRHELGRRTVD